MLSMFLPSRWFLRIIAPNMWARLERLPFVQETIASLQTLKNSLLKIHWAFFRLHLQCLIIEEAQFLLASFTQEICWYDRGRRVSRKWTQILQHFKITEITTVILRHFHWQVHFQFHQLRLQKFLLLQLNYPQFSDLLFQYPLISVLYDPDTW